MEKHDDPRREVNPAARRDAPGEPHDDLAARRPEEGAKPVKPFQEEPLSPVDQGGIGE